MTKLFAFFLVLISIASACLVSVDSAKAQPPNSWITMAPLPAPMVFGRFGGAVSNDKIYITGQTNTTEYLENFQYDPTTNAWQTKAPLPTFRMGFALTTFQNKIYMLGGLPGLNTQVYDPETNTWETKGPTAEPRMGAVANIVDDKIYVIGGVIVWNEFRSNPAVTSNWVYDPRNDSWAILAPLPTATKYYASAVVYDKIYIFGGLNPVEFPDAVLNFVQIFDPKTNQWSQGTPMPVGVCYAAACTTTGLSASPKIYVVGGEYYNNCTERSVTNLTQIYDPQTDSWSAGASIPTARSYLSLTNIDDTLFAIGGKNGGSSSVNEKFAPMEYPPPLTTPSSNATPSPYIIPSPSIPEFHTWIVLPLVFVSTLLAASVMKLKKKVVIL
jgi:N-acetylneuraminic acid mutarotase